MDSLRSQCSGFPAVTPMDAVPSYLPYIQQPGTLGTLGTGLKRHELGLAHTGNRRGTPGTNWWKARGDAGADRYSFYDRSGALPSIAGSTLSNSGIEWGFGISSMGQA